MIVFLCVACLLRGLAAAPVADLPLQPDGHHLDTRRSADPDRIVYPDEVTRDSYGNPVTPFSGLLDVPAIDNVGHMTDVNKDTTQPLTEQGFVIPSYASGITKVETIYPKAPQFPAVAPTKAAPPTAAHPPGPNTAILPPYKDEEERVNYPKIEVNTQQTLFFANAGVPQPQAPESSPIPGAAQPIDINHQIIHTGDSAPPQPQQPNEIYRGSFGGAPGVLGDNQPIGWAYALAKDPTAAKPAVTSGSSPDLNLLPPPPSNPAQSVPRPPSATSDIYRGSFGGAPGILKPYDNAPRVHRQ